jgi:hypothetical protein
MKTLTALWALCLAGAAWAQEDSKARIDELVKQLGDEYFETRSKAAEELKKIGAPALEALRKAAADSPDAEVRQRARELVEAIEKPRKTVEEKPPAEKPAAPAKPRAARGCSVSVTTINGDSKYTFTPADGTPFTFHKNADGSVKLEYANDRGEEKSASAESLDAFLKDQKDLAAQHGITKDGIEYAGAKVSFDGAHVVRGVLRGFRIQPGKFMWKRQGDEDEEDEDWEEFFGQDFPFDRGTSSAAGAAIEGVPSVLRSHLEIPEGQGVVIGKVKADSVAAKAGLKQHDILLAIDGNKVVNAKDVRALLTKDSKATVIRGGKKQTLGEEKK